MLVPASNYVWINQGGEVAVQGWAIPAATEIAFALAILALLGSRVRFSLKIFLVSLAIFDDIGANPIIALFYTHELSLQAFGVVACCLSVLMLLNRRGVLEKAPYVLIGVILWVAVLKSGVHATLAGVVLALFIPLRNPEIGTFPRHELEHDLHTAIAFDVLPIFAFANAGISLDGVSTAGLLHPIPLGITAGLFVGKQLGVFLFCWLGIRFGVARLPAGLTWPNIYGAAVLCGVGFTMSLFIASIAFEETDVNLLYDERLGFIAGSILSGVCDYFLLRHALPVQPRQ